MSLPSPLCFSPWPWGSGAAWWPCKAQFHASASAQPLLARRMLLLSWAALPEECWLRRGCCHGDFHISFAQRGGTRSVGTGWTPRTLSSSLWVLCGCGALRFPVPTASCQLTPAPPCGRAEGRGWAEPGVVPVRGSRLAPAAPAATSATETLRRMGAARSHLPLIEFICYNPKQCKAGFSQAPAACLPIKIPSRTANPPSRLDIKQPVSKKRQEKSPCVRAEPLLPILLPQGPWPAGLPIPFLGGSGRNKCPAERLKAHLCGVRAGQTEPPLAHRRFPVGFSILIGVAGSGPATGIVTPAAKV